MSYKNHVRAKHSINNTQVNFNRLIWSKKKKKKKHKKKKKKKKKKNDDTSKNEKNEKIEIN